MKKVSVVLPVYHAEQYIEECMNSLLRQTLEEIEIICVLDCPKDKTGSILKEIARKDHRIVLIENEKNMGAACSRNIGMGYVTAPYVIFLDADDMFEPDMLEVLYHRIEETKADMCLFEFDTFFNEKEWLVSGNEQESKYTGVFSIADMPEDELAHLGAATWNRIYRRSFLERNKLSFQNLKTGNDVYIGIISLLLAEKIVHTKTNKAFLHYRLGSPNQISANANPKDTCMAYQKVHDELKERGLWNKYKNCFWIKFLLSLTREITNGNKEEYSQQAYRWIQEEGVSALEIADAKEEDFDYPYYATGLRKLIEMDYESGWFRYNIGLQMKLDYNKEKIINQCSLWMEKGKRIAVWGAGQYGCTLLHFFDEHQIHCDTVIDSNPNKQGTYVEHRKIQTFENVPDTLDIIIVAIKNYGAQIRKMVFERDDRIIAITIEEMFGGDDVL